MGRRRAELVGFEFCHSIDGEGWPDAVVLEIDDGNECEQRRYHQAGADVDVLAALADRMEEMAGMGYALTDTGINRVAREIRGAVGVVE